MPENRISTVTRDTKETQINIMLNIDGRGASNIDTGIGFFDHMLSALAKHGFFDLEVKVSGDLNVDGHHTVEDTGIVLGSAIKEALGDKVGIRRFGSSLLPMDETLAMCAIDLGGRPYFSFDVNFSDEKCGSFETALVKEFFYAISYSAGMNLHMRLLSGGNSHHMIEALFKSFAKSLDEATTIDPRLQDVLSTKGTLE